MTTMITLSVIGDISGITHPELQLSITILIGDGIITGIHGILYGVAAAGLVIQIILITTIRTDHIMDGMEVVHGSITGITIRQEQIHIMPD
jgi:hypothetical protein